MSPGWLVGDAPAKINLALVVGQLREDGKHVVATVLQALELADTVELRRAEAIAVEGFASDTIVRAALEALEAESGATLGASITKRIPVAAGLGGGSSDAATALRLGNELLGRPVAPERLAAIAAGLGADVPFFLGSPQQLGEEDGTRLSPLALPVDYTVLLAVPHDQRKESTAAVYSRFDEREGHAGFHERRLALADALGSVTRAADLGRLPANDLASSPLSAKLMQLGAFRADVSGAGPTVYGLFAAAAAARRAAAALDARAATLLTAPRVACPEP